MYSSWQFVTACTEMLLQVDCVTWLINQWTEQLQK